ncbi:hypothetical protein IAT38_001940 [Cryptococcus sp. DSM 104549]
MSPAPNSSSSAGGLTTLAPITEVHPQIFDDFRHVRPLVANLVNSSEYDRITPSLYRHLSLTSDNIEGVFYNFDDPSGRKAELLEGAESLTLGFSGEGDALRRGLEEMLGPAIQAERSQASPDGEFIPFPNVKEVRLGLAMSEPYNRKEYGRIEFYIPFLFPRYQHLTWDIPVFPRPTNREERYSSGRVPISPRSRSTFGTTARRARTRRLR